MIKVKRLESYCCPYHDLWGSKKELYRHKKDDKCNGTICQSIIFVDEKGNELDG